ncbi:MAG: hypothetical protein RMM31_09625 [Anaerolineae bacterium]|nr:DUF4175 domain-containing protein [Thermoflexales bacterium]MDW8396487.1 hypothetical protein [Anaerolineae bacterium]
MKFLNGDWPILAIVILFLVIPLSTLPGLFDPIFVLIMMIGLVIAGLTALAVLARRSNS